MNTVSTEKTEQSQREIFAEELKNLKKDVTKADRLAFMDEIGWSINKTSNYFNGRVADNDEAIKMLLFFRKRIKERYEVVLNNK